MTESGAVARPREQWINIARAVCIVLVVFLHVTLYTRDALPDSRVRDLLFGFSEILEPLRIPLFFAVSGYLAARAVRAPWSATIRRKRIYDMYWKYLVWLLIVAAITWAIPGDLGDVRTIPRLILFVFVGLTPLWYLWALVVYYVITRAAQRWAIPALAIAGIICGAASTELLPNFENSTKLLQNLFFFMLAALYPNLVVTVRDNASVKWAALSGVVFLAGSLALWRTGIGVVPITRPIVSLAAIAFGIIVAVWISRWLKAGGLVNRIGAETLPIYVMHIPLICIGAVVVPDLSDVTGLVYVPVVTVLVVAVCLVIYRPLITYTPWLFTMPRRSDTPTSRHGLRAR